MFIDLLGVEFAALVERIFCCLASSVLGHAKDVVIYNKSLKSVLSLERIVLTQGIYDARKEVNSETDSQFVQGMDGTSGDTEY
jgi:hypothetical protein